VGEALSLVCVDEYEYLRGIEKLIKLNLDKSTVTGFEPDPSIKAEPISLGGGGKGRSRNQRPRSSSRHAPKKRSDNTHNRDKNRK